MGKIKRIMSCMKGIGQRFHTSGRNNVELAPDIILSNTEFHRSELTQKNGCLYPEY